MKTAKKIIDAVDLICPYCDESIPAPGGSLFWTVAELPETGEPLTCPFCKKQSKTPKV